MAKKAQPDRAALKQLKQELKEGTPRSLYVFHGEETYLKEYYFRQLKRRLISEGLEQFNFHAIPGKECTLRRLREETDCLPVMSERTLVAVTDFDLYGGTADAREELCGLLSALPEDCCLVFYYDLLPFKADARMKKLTAALTQNGLVVDFARQDPSDLKDWIARRFKALGHEIDPREAAYLLEQRGELMQELVNEIEKIGAYAPHRRITRADIDAVVIPQLDAAVFQMTDALSRGDFDGSAAVLDSLLSARESAIMILSVMGKYFRQLYTARLLLERRRGTAELAGLWSMKSAWQAEKLMDAARRYTLPWCRNAVKRCAETDLAMKSYGGEENDLLVGLLTELAAGRAAK